MQTHLITPDEVMSLSRGISIHVSDEKIETYLIESENLDIKPALGDALFLDIKANPDKYKQLLSGGEYEDRCGGKRLLVGLKSALAYYTYARLAKNGDGNITRFGFVNKDYEYSNRLEYKEKQIAYNDAFDVASRYMKECIDYLCENREKFPLFKRGRIKTNGTRYRVRGK